MLRLFKFLGYLLAHRSKLFAILLILGNRISSIVINLVANGKQFVSHLVT